jgi:peptidoglycan L-alanyl-D-glutamate endopeptidase CwlK
MASRNLDDLAPELRIKCLQLIHHCKQRDIDLVVICTYRSDDEQNELYSQGRDTPGKIVTNAKAGQSAHNATLKGRPYSMAFDCVPVTAGKPIWSTTGANLTLWKEIGELGKALGLIWAGDWSGKLVEYGHFQLPLWGQTPK